jgi:GT2 family glycosyltransferase
MAERVKDDAWSRVGVAAFKPVRMLDVELGKELPPVPTRLGSGRSHERALVLVRLHDCPLGLVALALGEHGLEPTELAEQLWRALAPEINEHLRRDRLSVGSGLPVGGLVHSARPRCIEEREAALVDAGLTSIVVATRDGESTLQRCLDSLLELEYPSYEIIVVDNASRSDESKNLVTRRYLGMPSSPVRYVRQGGPAVAARNRGLAEARGAWVAFTDDDVIVDRWWLLELVRAFDDGRVGCVTGMILPAELETPAQAWLEQYGGFTKGFRHRMFDLYENRPETPLFPYAAGMFGSGANMAFRTELLRRLGGFDLATGPGTRARGGEDLAAFFNVIAGGHTLAYAPAAVIYHRHRKDYASLREQAYSYGVGLGAYLTKTVVDEPRRLVDVARRLPHGLLYLLDPTSEKNANKGTDYPRELSWLEGKGLLYGPFAYLRGRRESRAWIEPSPVAEERSEMATQGG